MLAVCDPCDTRPVRRLVLIRHAKAAVGDLDRRRPLTPEGLTASEGIGRYLADNEPAPDRVVTSPARRAAETWAAAARALTNPPEPNEDERIYDNTLDSLQGRDSRHSAAMSARSYWLGTIRPCVISPRRQTMERATPELRKILADRFPTAAVAVFDISEDWATLDQGTLSGLHLRSR